MSRVFVSKSRIRPSNGMPLWNATRNASWNSDGGLEQIEYFCKGTVLQPDDEVRQTRCVCASDPTKRHGPYFELTYKANGKRST